MCLAIPGRIIDIEGNLATVDFSGAKKKIALDLVEAKEGQYVLVHAGFAIKVISERDARKNIELLERLGELMEDDVSAAR